MMLKDKTCIVTGAAGALGAAVSKVLIGHGAHVMGIDYAVLPAETPGISKVDLTDADQAKAAIDKAATEMGSLFALVNIAGGFRWEKIAGGKLTTWDAMFAINLKTAVNASMAALPHLQKNGKGRVVNIGAGAAAAKASAGMGAYTASKAGVAKLTEALAEETKANGITVNAVLPSTIDTPANRKDMADADFSKWVQPEEIGELIAFLISDEAKSITGASIPISGRV